LESEFHSPVCKLELYPGGALPATRGVYGTGIGDFESIGGLERPKSLLFSFCLAPMARRIMLSIVLTVFALTLTACPEMVCTLRRPRLVRSEVKKTSARGGRGGGAGLGALELGEAEAWLLAVRLAE
jgi:hypothetical protein